MLKTDCYRESEDFIDESVLRACFHENAEITSYAFMFSFIQLFLLVRLCVVRLCVEAMCIWGLVDVAVVFVWLMMSSWRLVQYFPHIVHVRLFIITANMIVPQCV